MIKTNIARSAFMALSCAVATPAFAEDNSRFDPNPLTNPDNVSAHEMYINFRVIDIVDRIFRTPNFPEVQKLNPDQRADFVIYTLEKYVDYERDLHSLSLVDTMEHYRSEYGDKAPYFMVFCQDGPSDSVRETIVNDIDEIVGLDFMDSFSVNRLIDYFSEKHMPSLYLSFYVESSPARGRGMQAEQASCNQFSDMTLRLR
jgi:hypothetical protein